MHCREEVRGPVPENPSPRIRVSIQPVTATNEQGRKEYEPAQRKDHHRQKTIFTIVGRAVPVKKKKKEKKEKKKIMMIMLAAIR